MKLIGLTGRAGAGKDTVADFLCETQAFVRIALADPIRAGLAAMFGIQPAAMLDRELKETVIPHLGKSPRQLAQTLGTEWGRYFVATDVWLRVAQQKIATHTHNAEMLHIAGIVVTDIRFEDEADWLRAQGGTVWHIQRLGDQDGTTSQHASEAGIAWRDGDRLVPNVGTVEDLHYFILATLGQDDEEPACSA